MLKNSISLLYIVFFVDDTDSIFLSVNPICKSNSPLPLSFTKSYEHCERKYFPLYLFTILESSKTKLKPIGYFPQVLYLNQHLLIGIE